jgi:hypothetical protein
MVSEECLNSNIRFAWCHGVLGPGDFLVADGIYAQDLEGLKEGPLLLAALTQNEAESHVASLSHLAGHDQADYPTSKG